MLKASLGILVAALVTAAAPHVRAQDVLRAEEDRVFSMVNATRVEHGLPPLVRHDGLVGVARQQSIRMLEQSRLYHNPDLRGDLDALGLDWHWSGENVGVGPTADAIEAAFLASPSHYENIVRPNYTAMGVGVFGPTKSGAIYVTQVFAELAATPASRPAPSATRPPMTPPAPAPTPQPAAMTHVPATPSPTETPMPSHHVVIEGGVTNDTPVPALV